MKSKQLQSQVPRQNRSEMAFSFILTSDGSSDQMLLPLILWLLESHAGVPFSGGWANPNVFDDKSRDIQTRIAQTIAYYPSDIIFAHRDAEAVDLNARILEVSQAAVNLGIRNSTVVVVPVRMTEAWFLFDEAAIRNAAGNPNSNVQLNLPTINQCERLADPKSRLDATLLAASEATGRRRAKLSSTISELKHLVALRIDSFDRLRRLAAFQRFEAELVTVLSANNWAQE
jgi:hypothetical protein